MKLSILLALFLISDFVLTAQQNLLKGKNPECNGTAYYTYGSSTNYTSSDSHTNDGSGCFKFTGQGSIFLKNSVMTTTVNLVAGRKYEMRVYMKMTNAPDGQNIFLKAYTSSGSYPVEMLWNINENDEWEECILPYTAQYTGPHYFKVFAWPKYMHTTDGEYGLSDGSNLALCPTVYIDDFSVIEMTDEEIISNEPPTPKTPFSSEYIKVDAEGNYMVKENGTWKNIFPRIAYQSWYGDFAQESANMSEYGFNGWANIMSISTIQTAVQKGMKYNAIQINTLSDGTKSFIESLAYNMNNGNIPHTSVISYLIDNEMTALCNYEMYKSYGPWIDENDKDPVTNKRARPIFVFNGQAEGVARSYNNSNNNLMDVTGSYISGSGEESDFRYNPISNISLLRNTDKQKAPVTFLDVQAYYHYAFIPSIFKGIINGAKGLAFWRGGTTYRGSTMDFRDNVWAPALKGPDGVFARIDSMLIPIITQPLSTPWSATISSEDRQTIAIGTRDNQVTGKHYIILANFSDQDESVQISLNGINATSATNFFTDEPAGTVINNTLTVDIGHYNNGYLVLELNNVTGIHKIDKTTSVNIYPNPATDYIYINSSEAPLSKVEIIDIAGTNVKNISLSGNSKTSINVSNLVKGIYFIKAYTTDNKIAVFKELIK